MSRELHHGTEKLRNLIAQTYFSPYSMLNSSSPDSELRRWCNTNG
jgi:hypothetical protein